MKNNPQFITGIISFIFGLLFLPLILLFIFQGEYDGIISALLLSAVFILGGLILVAGKIKQLAEEKVRNIILLSMLIAGLLGFIVVIIISWEDIWNKIVEIFLIVFGVSLFTISSIVSLITKLGAISILLIIVIVLLLQISNQLENKK